MFQVWFKGIHFDFEDEEEAMLKFNSLIKQYPKNHIMVSEEIEYEVIQILKEINPLKTYPNPYRTNSVLYGVPRI